MYIEQVSLPTYLFKVNYSSRSLLYKMVATLQVNSIESRINLFCQARIEK